MTLCDLFILTLNHNNLILLCLILKSIRIEFFKRFVAAKCVHEYQTSLSFDENTSQSKNAVYFTTKSITQLPSSFNTDVYSLYYVKLVSNIYNPTMFQIPSL